MDLIFLGAWGLGVLAAVYVQLFLLLEISSDLKASLPDCDLDRQTPFLLLGLFGFRFQNQVVDIFTSCSGAIVGISSILVGR